VRKAIRAAGAKLLFLPPYSPDLNPIKQVLAKLKLLLRKAAERTVEATWQRIGTFLDAFPPSECAKYLRDSGHASIYVKQALEGRQPTLKKRSFAHLLNEDFFCG
jgi:DDE superfamily endonuclease